MTSTHLFSRDEMTQRLDRVHHRMHDLGLEALVATPPANVRYLTGFKGEPRALLVTPDHFLLVTALRTLPWAKDQTTPLQDALELATSDEPASVIASRLSKKGLSIGLDQGIPHPTLLHWQKALAPAEVAPHSVIEHVRRLKSPAEIALMRQSQELNEAIFAAVLPQIRPHMTERGVQGLLLAEMARHETVDAYSFPPIVAVGPNCWEIHHLPDHTVIGRDQMLLLDLGVIRRGYASDMTRTICLGKASPEMQDIHEIVTAALEAATWAALADTSNRAVDGVAREIITRAGHGEVFTHGLGHQIGLQAHDPAPPLSQKAPEIPLEPGMAFTIEPGIYLKNRFGVRTEDVVVITEDQPRNLTRPSHDLLELPV